MYSISEKELNILRARKESETNSEGLTGITEYPQWYQNKDGSPREEKEIKINWNNIYYNYSMLQCLVNIFCDYIGNKGLEKDFIKTVSKKNEDGYLNKQDAEYLMEEGIQ